MIPAVGASNFLRFGLALIIQFLGDLLLVALLVQSGQAAEDLQPGRLGDGGLNSSCSTSTVRMRKTDYAHLDSIRMR